MLTCIYCGEPATERDHVIPVKFSRRGPRLSKRCYSLGPLVDACRDCNMCLGARCLFTVAERRAYVYSCLHRKLKSALRCRMTFADLEGLGDSLRSRLAVKIEDRERAERRIAFAALPFDGEEPT